MVNHGSRENETTKSPSGPLRVATRNVGLADAAMITVGVVWFVALTGTPSAMAIGLIALLYLPLPLRPLIRTLSTSGLREAGYRITDTLPWAVCAAFTGGLSSFVLPVVVFIPLVGAFRACRGEALIGALIAVSSISGLFLLDTTGQLPPSLVPAAAEAPSRPWAI